MPGDSDSAGTVSCIISFMLSEETPVKKRGKMQALGRSGFRFLSRAFPFTIKLEMLTKIVHKMDCSPEPRLDAALLIPQSSMMNSKSDGEQSAGPMPQVVCTAPLLTSLGIMSKEMCSTARKLRVMFTQPGISALPA